MIRPAAAIGHIEVRYFLTGAFGGYGSFVRNPDGDGAYRIPLEQEGRRANSLKAILYAPGCQFTTLSVDLMNNATRNVMFECRQLSAIALNGRISPPPSGTAPLDVEFRYLADWDHGFFGIIDGAIQSFSLGKAPLKAGGRFQIQIPDLSKDRFTNQMQDAHMEVLVVEHLTWNIVEWVLPPANLQYHQIGLKILASYEPEIDFTK